MTMSCPECGKWTRVLQTRSHEDYVQRRYECGNMHRFSTIEKIISGRANATKIPSAQQTCALTQKGKLT